MLATLALLPWAKFFQSKKNKKIKTIRLSDSTIHKFFLKIQMFGHRQPPPSVISRCAITWVAKQVSIVRSTVQIFLL